MEGLREEAIMSKQLGALINISFVYFLAQVAKAERPVKNNLTKVMTEDQKKIHDFAPYWEQREKNKKFLAQSKPPTIEQVKAQMERQKRERSNLN